MRPTRLLSRKLFKLTLAASVSAVILVCDSFTRMVNNLSSTYVHYHEHLEGEISAEIVHTVMDTTNNSVEAQDANYTSIL